MWIIWICFIIDRYIYLHLLEKILLLRNEERKEQAFETLLTSIHFHTSLPSLQNLRAILREQIFVNLTFQNKVFVKSKQQLHFMTTPSTFLHVNLKLHVNLMVQEDHQPASFERILIQFSIEGKSLYSLVVGLVGVRSWIEVRCFLLINLCSPDSLN